MSPAIQLHDMEESAKRALERAERLLARGEEDDVRTLVLKWRSFPGQFPEDYYRWAKLCEDLGLDNLAYECITRAVSISPENPRYLFEQANISYRLGLLNETARTLKRILQIKESSTIREFLASVLREMGQEGSARVVSGKVHRKRFLLRWFPPDLGHKELEPFFLLFKGRKIHAELMLTPLGDVSAVLRNGGISLQKLKDHLLGRTYLIYFPLLDDKTVTAAYILIRVPKKQIEKHLREDAWLERKRERVKEVALKAFRTCSSWGLNPVLERMHKFKYRLWFFFDTPVHFLWVKRFLESVIEHLPYPESEIVYSLGIPTKGVGVGWKERGFEMPLGVHPATLERSLFVDAEGKPYPEQLRFVKRIVPMSFPSLKDFCKGKQFRFPEVDVNVQLVKLMSKCAVINHIVKRAEIGKRLSREEKIAIILTVGFLKNGKDLVHRILSGTPDYSYIKLERMLRSAPPRPISCDKLEIWFSNFVLDMPCVCIFGKLLKNRYPSPLLHVDPNLVPMESERLCLERSNPSELGKVYLKLKEKLAFVERQLLGYLKNSPSKKLGVGDFLIYLDGETIRIKGKN